MKGRMKCRIKGRMNGGMNRRPGERRDETHDGEMKTGPTAPFSRNAPEAYSTFALARSSLIMRCTSCSCSMP